MQCVHVVEVMLSIHWQLVQI